MLVLHAIWTDSRLHLWGELASGASDAGSPAAGLSSSPGTEPTAFAADDDKLRRDLGDAWDTLLVSGARSGRLSLLLPHDSERPIPSSDVSLPSEDLEEAARPRLQPHEVPTLAFEPADAVDLLTELRGFEREDLQCGASLRFWSSVAGLVLELLAKQRFVPAIQRSSLDQGARDRGYWRVVVDDAHTSERLSALIVSMPPICRALADHSEPVQASALLENFLWTTVDALVRRCLEGDELAHALHERVDEDCSLQTLWLRSLVRSEPAVHGTPDQRLRIYETVGGWLSKLEPHAEERSCITCFRLHPPPGEKEGDDGDALPPWRLTLHVQAVDDPNLVLDAAALWDEQRRDPMILKRPFANARTQLRADLRAASRHFPPLAPMAEANGPLECTLSLEEAYRFLRDATPILEQEGFGVWLPRWWRTNRPRLRMQLDLRPATSDGAAPAASMRLDSIIEYNWRIALGEDGLTAKELETLSAAKEPLIRLRGQWVEVQSSELKAALAFLDRRRSGRLTVLEALRQYYATDDLDTGLPTSGLEGHGWVRSLLDASNVNGRLEPVAQPAGFHGTLRAYQLRGLEWLRFLSKHGLGACLADDMGLGKTIQFIALLLCEREQDGPTGPTLLVVPMSLVGNWKREIEKFGPSLRVMVHHGMERLSGKEFVDAVGHSDVVISTYGLTHRDFEHLENIPWHRIALDEAQNIKNPVAKQSVSIRSLQAVHRVALTGTPVENRLSELWAMLDFLNPGYLSTAAEFRRRYAVPIERHHDADRAERLRHLIRPFLLRRRKDDPNILPDLPAKMEMTVFCNLTPEQAALYEAIVKDMIGHIDRSGGIQRRGLILATLTRLKQVCNHPAQFLADGSALPRRSGKCERLTEMLGEVVAEGHRALVFTQYRQMGDLLQPLLQETLDREILFLHGGTSQKARDKLVQRFQEGSDATPVFLLSLKAGGFGLNLTAANHVFHFDRWWNPAVEDQATDRAHRIGQYRQVQVHKFVCIGTLEERIGDMLEAKRRLADRVIGSGEQWLTELSTDALRDLFTLSREAVAED